MGRRLLTIKQRNQIRTTVDFASTVFPRKITGGDYFYFRTKRRRLFKGGDYFRYFSQEVVPYTLCFIIPSDKGKSEIHEHYHRKKL